jgi:hypothetical protein
MTPFNGRSIVSAALALLLILLVGPGQALGADPGLILYELTEDMYLLSNDGQPVQDLVQAVRRSAVAQLTGFAKVGTPLCPWDVLVLTPGAKQCVVNASGADHLSLADGKGTLGGTFAVVIQDTNKVDAPEFVVMTGSFAGDADLSLPFANVAPTGFLTRGRGCIDGYPCDLEKAPVFTFTGTFRLPFMLAGNVRTKPIRHRQAYYLADDFRTLIRLAPHEQSLGWPTVRLEINFQ